MDTLTVPYREEALVRTVLGEWDDDKPDSRPPVYSPGRWMRGGEPITDPDELAALDAKYPPVLRSSADG